MKVGFCPVPELWRDKPTLKSGKIRGRQGGKGGNDGGCAPAGSALFQLIQQFLEIVVEIGVALITVYIIILPALCYLAEVIKDIVP